jgi:hypothetical protein
VYEVVYRYLSSPIIRPLSVQRRAGGKTVRQPRLPQAVLMHDLQALVYYNFLIIFETANRLQMNVTSAR